MESGIVGNGMSGQAEERNRMVDVLKGICAILVIVNHFNLAQEDRMRFLFPYWVDMAVPVFMIISGYVYSISYEHRHVTTWKEAYHYIYVVEKLLRYTIPFLIAISIEWLVNVHYYGLKNAVVEWISALFTGGRGMGAYYYPIMIQFIFLFPLIYFLIKKYDFCGLVLCFLCNVLFEWLQRLYGFSDVSYRLLIFRYMLLIAFGCYLYAGRSVPKRWVSLLSMFTGIAYIWLCCYDGYELKVIIYWSRTSFAAALYIMPVIGMMLSSQICRKIGCRPLELLGKASYNIFLTQMVFYNYLVWDIYELEIPRIVLLLISIVICLIAGTAFYCIERKITEKILLYLRGKEYGAVFAGAVKIINSKLTGQKEAEVKEDCGKNNTDGLPVVDEAPDFDCCNDVKADGDDRRAECGGEIEAGCDDNMKAVC